MRVRLEARLAGARIPVQVDVAFGDVVIPQHPSLLRSGDHGVEVPAGAEAGLIHGQEPDGTELVVLQLTDRPQRVGPLAR